MPETPVNLTSTPQVKHILSRYGLRPKKRLGQNFLTDRNVLDRITSASGAGPGTNVLEIGAGLGVLTRALAETGARVVSVESDLALKPVLAETVGAPANAEIVFEDFLKIDLDGFLGSRAQERWIIAGNLPYYITTPIIVKIVNARSLIRRAILMVQREVADRLTAAPGTADYGAIGLFVNYHFDTERVMRVSRNAFFPVPEVDSELLLLTPRETPLLKVTDENVMFRIIRAAFGKRRKTLLNSLSSSVDLGWDKSEAARVLEESGIDPSRRAETLTLAEFASIANVFSDAAPGPSNPGRI